MWFYNLMVVIRQQLINFWYWLMKPIAYFFTSEKEKKRYKKKEDKITEAQAVKWIAEDIVRYLIRNKEYDVAILICDWANENDFWEDCCLTGTVPYYLRRKKTIMAFYKFKKTIKLQEKIVDKLKEYKSVAVTEKIEDLPSWKRINSYKKTVIITYRR